MDKILLSDCQFSVHLGVTKLERTKVQTILIDLELCTDLTRPGHSDTLTDTINYSQIHAAIFEHLKTHSFNLVEALAEQLAALLLKNFPLTQIRIRIKKPSALKKKKVAWAGEEIVRP